jgi:hypothetical protein
MANTKKRIPFLIAVCLFFLLPFFPGIIEAGEKPGPSIQWTTIRSYKNHDGSFGIVTMAGLNSPSPDDVASFTATGPLGTFNLAPVQSGLNDGLYYFDKMANATGGDGLYTFTVTDHEGRTATSVVSFTYNGTLPKVDSATMDPPNGSYVGTTTPTFSWDPVLAPGVYYQVGVQDILSAGFWWSSDRTQATSCTIPPGILKPDMPYKWRIRVFESQTDPNNYHQSEELTFFTGIPEPPSLDHREVAIVSFLSDPSLQDMSIGYLKVAPWDIASLVCIAPDSTVYSLDVQDPRFYGGYMYGGTTAFILDGTYTFEIEDTSGNTDVQTLTHAFDPLPPVPEASRVPEDNHYFYTDSPTFSWDPISGSTPYYYMLRVRDYNNQIKWWSSPVTTSTSATVPAGVLPWNCSFKWQVYALDHTDMPELTQIYVSPRRTFSICRANNPPDRPAALYPSHEAAISGVTQATLRASAFSDPENDDHYRTYWMVRRADRPYGCGDYDPSFSQVATLSGLTEHTLSGIEPGLKYCWKVAYEDSASGVSRESSEYAFKTGESTAGTVVSVPPGTDEKAFKMVSFCRWPDDPQGAAVFGDEMGGVYDTFNYRIGSYDPTSGEGGYVECGSALQVAPGKACWVLARNGMDISAKGVGATKNYDVEVPLGYNSGNGNGWNQIGCPNEADYYWANVQVVEYNADGQVISGPVAISDLPDPNVYMDKRLWRWEDGSYYSDTAWVRKHEGYWVRAKRPNLRLRFPTSAQAGLARPGTLFACMIHEGKRVFKEWILTPEPAIADSGDAPPAPIGGFRTSSGAGSGGGAGKGSSARSPGGGRGGAGGGAGCFISTVSAE